MFHSEFANFGGQEIGRTGVEGNGQSHEFADILASGFPAARNFALGKSPMANGDCRCKQCGDEARFEIFRKSVANPRPEFPISADAYRLLAFCVPENIEGRIVPNHYLSLQKKLQLFIPHFKFCSNISLEKYRLSSESRDYILALAKANRVEIASENWH